MTILTAKNALLEPNISMKEIAYWDPLYYSPNEPRFPGNRGLLSNGDIERIMNSPSFFYLTNQLVLNLTPSPDETMPNRFKTDIPLVEAINTCDLFWRGAGLIDTVQEWDNWTHFPGPLDVTYTYPYQARIVTVSQNKLTLEFPRETIQLIKENMALDNREFGILMLDIEFMTPEMVDRVHEGFRLHYAIKVTTNEIFEVRSERRAEERPPNQPEYITPFYSFESLFIPTLSCDVVYNFYEPEEEEYETIIRRDYTGYKLSDIPKYVELTWTQAPFYREPLVAVTEVGASESPGGSAGSTTVLGGHVFNLRGSDAARAVGRVPSGVGGLSPSLIGRAGEAFREDGFLTALASESSGESEARTGDASVGGAGVRFDVDLPGIGSVDSRIDPRVTSPATPELVYPWMKSEYVGYSIQKERYNEVDEIFEPIDVFLINGRLKNKFRDWNVAYREVYRYRIRSIFRFVNKYGLPMYRDSDELIDNSQEFSKFETSIAKGHAESYYYDSKSSDDCEIEVIETRSPDSPFNVRLYPCSRKKEIFITWNQKNQNNDIVGFNVYRKLESELFFRRVNSDLIGIRDNFWVDVSIEEEVRYIYAIETVDVHDNFSKLSAQYSAMIVPQNIDILHKKCEAPVEFVEWAGEEIGRRSLRDMQTRMDHLMFTKRQMKIRVNSLFSNGERTDPFKLNVISLDTNEKKEILMKFEIKTIYHRSPLIRYDDTGITSETPLGIGETERPIGPGVGPLRIR